MKYGWEGDSSSSDSAPSSPSHSPTRRTRRVRSQSTASTSTPKAPFSPAPVRIKQPVPTPRAKRGRVVPIHSASSDEDAGFGSSEDEEEEGEEEDDDSDEDSEEDQWPVGPVGSIGLGGWRTARTKGKGKARNQVRAETQRAFGGPDALDLWDEKEKASSWATATRTFHLSLSRNLSLSPVPTRAPAVDRDVSSIQSLLASLALEQTKSQTALVASFDQRNAALWTSIEASIRAAEEEEEGKRRVMEEQRRKSEEAATKAKEMREAEEKKKALEKVEAEKRKVEDEAKRAAGKQKAEEDRLKQELAARLASERAAKASVADGGSPQADWERWTAKMVEIKTSVLPVVSQNPAYRKACYTAKRAITPKIGQLTASSSATLHIIEHLHETLNGLRPPAGQPTATQPYTWTLNHLAKALVKQAETEVTAKLSTAYPLGRVVIGLLARGHTELGEVLMARFVKKCFWITGWWPPKRPGQTDEEHSKSLGHPPPTTAETLLQYGQRMSGLIALYAAILQASPLTPPQGPCPPSALSNIPPHFRPTAGWRWLVLILRAPLVALEPTPLLVVTFLEVAGEAMLGVFGRQMAKFLEVLLREGMREGKAGFSDKAKSSTMRLQLWLEEWEKTGRVEQTPGSGLDP